MSPSRRRATARCVAWHRAPLARARSHVRALSPCVLEILKIFVFLYNPLKRSFCSFVLKTHRATARGGSLLAPYRHFPRHYPRALPGRRDGRPPGLPARALPPLHPRNSPARAPRCLASRAPPRRRPRLAPPRGAAWQVAHAESFAGASPCAPPAARPRDRSSLAAHAPPSCALARPHAPLSLRALASTPP